MDIMTATVVPVDEGSRTPPARQYGGRGTGFFIEFSGALSDTGAPTTFNMLTTMARLPAFEDILPQVHQRLGLPRPPSTYLKEFAELKFSRPRHEQFAAELLGEIFDALEMDEAARRDASHNLDEWAAFESMLSAHVSTGEASEAQVLWHMLAYCWIPGLARRLALWSLDGAERGQPFDAGMPGGAFWFLPDWNQAAGKVREPVAQVLDWLLDLLGDQTLEATGGALWREGAKRTNEHALRTLQAWRLEGTLPKSAAMIGELFHDDARFDYRGAFACEPDAAPGARIVAALDFVRGRGLDAQALAHQIPLGAELVDAILAGAAADDDALRFADAVAIRWAAPPMWLVRQRLRIARMMQSGYRDLLAILCGKGVDSRCSDPAQNRLLPLLALFHTVYNRTIASVRHGATQAEQDEWFEAGFAPWDRLDLLLSIMPSLGDATAWLGERLTRRFMALAPDAPLQDLVPSGTPEQAAAVAVRRITLQEHELGDDARREALLAAPGLPAFAASLDAESSYLVASQVAQHAGLTPEAAAMALARVRELACTPAENAGACLLELDQLVIRLPPAHAPDAQARVAALLEQAEAHAGYDAWKAPFLRLRARHRLMGNDLAGAGADLRAALDACMERNHGPLRFQIARECLAVEVARRGLDPRSQDFLYRHIVRDPSTLSDQTSLADAAARAEDEFWCDLYQPYPGVERLDAHTQDPLKELVAQSVDLIAKGDLDGLATWLARNERKLRVLRMKDARRDSLLLLWMKGATQIEAMFAARARAAGRLVAAASPLAAHMRRAARLLLEAWPEQALLVDFKQQTPLMLAVDAGNVAMAQALAALSDRDAQDAIGRTALHAAVSGGSTACVAAVLALKPDTGKATFDEGQTALHTAVRFGNLQAVALLLQASPQLAAVANAVGETPAAQAADLVAHFDDWMQHMRAQRRRTGGRSDFEAVARLLSRS